MTKLTYIKNNILNLKVLINAQKKIISDLYIYTALFTAGSVFLSGDESTLFSKLVLFAIVFTVGMIVILIVSALVFPFVVKNKQAFEQLSESERGIKIGSLLGNLL
ncbi:hypothetical protein ACMZOO_08675 [Catenovulum sp. SX2]|uniref:hypothetical protein n=1 Tax=Catenovulum sp. SX2 TaxID=3398614 RepID=UPI003F85016C